MSWYDVFANFYDASLEKQYLDARARAVARLELRPGQVVVDAPCGTGQSFDGLVEGVGPEGQVLGFDQSTGMLRRGRARANKAGWTNVKTAPADLQTIAPEAVDTLAGSSTRVDRVLVFLGMSVFPDAAAAFACLWGLLTPGGRFVMVDCHSASPGLQGKMVNLMAGADIRRRGWEHLEAVAEDFSREDLPSTWQHGGTLYLASGLKPV